MTALVLTTTTFTLERKKIFGSFFTATNELLLGLVDEKLTSFQYPLAFFASIPHYRSTPLREVSISMPWGHPGPISTMHEVLAALAHETLTLLSQMFKHRKKLRHIQL